jgi:hypothetical protein
MKRSLFLLSIFLFLGIFAVNFTICRVYAFGFHTRYPVLTPKPDACTAVDD